MSIFFPSPTILFPLQIPIRPKTLCCQLFQPLAYLICDKITIMVLGKVNISTSEGSWSSYGNATHHNRGGMLEKLCYCGRKVTIRVSKTRKNPGRLFYSCPLNKEDEGRCQYFSWVDTDNDPAPNFNHEAENCSMTLMWKMTCLHKDVRKLATYAVVLGVLMIIVIILLVILLIK